MTESIAIGEETTPVPAALVLLQGQPANSEFIAKHPGLKPIVRTGLAHAIVVSAVAINTTPAGKMAMIGLLVLVQWHWLSGQGVGDREVQSTPDGEIAHLLVLFRVIMTNTRASLGSVFGS